MDHQTCVKRNKSDEFSTDIADQLDSIDPRTVFGELVSVTMRSDNTPIVYIQGPTTPAVINQVLGGEYLSDVNATPVVFVHSDDDTCATIESLDVTGRRVSVCNTSFAASEIALAVTYMAGALRTGIVRVRTCFRMGTSHMILVACADKYVMQYPADALVTAYPSAMTQHVLSEVFSSIFAFCRLPTSYAHVVTDAAQDVTGVAIAELTKVTARVMGLASRDWLLGISTTVFPLHTVTLNRIAAHVTINRDDYIRATRGLVKKVLTTTSLLATPKRSVPLNDVASNTFMDALHAGAAMSAFEVAMIATMAYIKTAESGDVSFAALAQGTTMIERTVIANCVLTHIGAIIPSPVGMDWESYVATAGDPHNTYNFTPIFDTTIYSQVSMMCARCVFLVATKLPDIIRHLRISAY